MLLNRMNDKYCKKINIIEKKKNHQNKNTQNLKPK